jgi:integrase
MKDQLKLSKSTINNRLAAIEKFYETNDVELRWKKIRGYAKGTKKKIRKKDRSYTHVEIAKMLSEADQRGKLAILLQFSAGIRVGGLATLKIDDLEKDEKYGIYKIKVYEGEEEEYTTWCSLECTNIIDSYLAYRQLHGERPLKDNAPLIRDDFPIDDEIRASRPKFLDVQTIRKIIIRIGIKSGVIERRPVINGRGELRLVMGNHGLRKAFQTTCTNAGMSPLYSEMLMGHRSGGLALETYIVSIYKLDSDEASLCHKDGLLFYLKPVQSNIGYRGRPKQPNILVQKLFNRIQSRIRDFKKRK